MTLVQSCVLPACPGRRELPAGAYACPDCQARLVRKLADIEDYLDIVSPVPGRSGDPGPMTGRYESRPPARLDVIAMLDPRTELNGPGEDDVLGEVPNVWAELDGWCQLVHEEHPDHPVGGLWLLRSYTSWIITRPWVDEFAKGISDVHAVLRRVCHDEALPAVGKCNRAGCGGDVYRRSDDPLDPRLRCSMCRTIYDGFDLLKVGRAS